MINEILTLGRPEITTELGVTEILKNRYHSVSS
jgi:hypothetical protein